MTSAENERLAVVEEKVDAMDGRLERMEKKLDTAITCKADKTEVDELRRLMWGAAAALCLTLLGLGAYVLQQLIARAIGS